MLLKLTILCAGYVALFALSVGLMLWAKDGIVAFPPLKRTAGLILLGAEMLGMGVLFLLGMQVGVELFKEYLGLNVYVGTLGTLLLCVLAPGAVFLGIIVGQKKAGACRTSPTVAR